MVRIKYANYLQFQKNNKLGDDKRKTNKIIVHLPFDMIALTNWKASPENPLLLGLIIFSWYFIAF